MSLESLRAMRLKGIRPDVPVMVLLGHKPDWTEDSPRLVVLTEGSKPADIDFRPLIGLWAALLLNEPLYDLAARVLDAMQEVTAKPYGVVLHDGSVHMGIADPTPEHVNNLRATWELYAQ